MGHGRPLRSRRADGAGRRRCSTEPTHNSRCGGASADRKSTRLNSSHANIYPLSLHGALPICRHAEERDQFARTGDGLRARPPLPGADVDPLAAVAWAMGDPYGVEEPTVRVDGGVPPNPLITAVAAEHPQIGRAHV